MELTEEDTRKLHYASYEGLRAGNPQPVKHYLLVGSGHKRMG